MDETGNELPLIRMPLPSYKEKIDGVEESLKEWAKHKHYHRPGVKLSEVAAETGIASIHISYCVRNRMKMNFPAWLNSLRIEDAKRMIHRNPDIPSYEVGYKIGCPNPETFKKVFQKFAGCTFNEYVPQIKAQQ
ncbi:MAG: helix-turn-helix domain-containing protein [Bacteroidaceae bacterium]|nr:helix-turn-helix domain-containing protein [Bacteroidaceae bacterium]